MRVSENVQRVAPGGTRRLRHGRLKRRRTGLRGGDRSGPDGRFVFGRAESGSALVARKEDPDADDVEAKASDPPNEFRTDVFGNQGATRYAQCGGQDQRPCRRSEDPSFRMRGGGSVQRRRKWGLVAKFGNEDPWEDGREVLDVHDRIPAPTLSGDFRSRSFA